MYDNSYKIKVKDILIPVGIIIDLIVIFKVVHVYKIWIHTSKVIIIKM
jgi:hypothetical protein